LTDLEGSKMARARAVLIPGLIAVLGVSAGSCQKVKMKLGIGDKVTNPDPGTPEAVIQDVLRAASDPDEEAGWERFSALLHSAEHDSPVALNDWRTMKFPAIRKKAGYLLDDRSAFSFVIMDRREEPPSLILLVKNSQSDLPTPCKLRPDPNANNAWRVFNACF